MRCRTFLSIVFLCLLPAVAVASCGSEHCPIDLGLPWDRSILSFDLTQQYIDQNQSRVGTEDVPLGTLPSGEDEVRTVSRITILHAVYQPSARWTLRGSLPFVNRYHEHIANEAGSPPARQIWNFEGVGDLEVSANRFFRTENEGGARYRLTVGVKAPTGVTTVDAIDGGQPEPPARPGNGAWAAIGGAGGEWRPTVKMPGGSHGVLPIRLSVLGRTNGRGTDRYQVGSEVQTNLGFGYPLTRAVEVLFSCDLRIRAKDEVGDSDADPGHTGGEWAFLSPGLRVAAGGRTALYGVVQLPVFQRVNGEQLVSSANIYFGVSRSIL